MFGSLLSLGLAQGGCNCSAGLEDLQVVQQSVVALQANLQSVADQLQVQCAGELRTVCMYNYVCVPTLHACHGICTYVHMSLGCMYVQYSLT